MKIIRAEKWQVIVPLREEVFELEGRFAPPNPSVFTAPKWIVRLHSDDGFDGIGESWRRESEESIDAAIAAVMGTDPRRGSLNSFDIPPGASYTTIEMALFDLLGKHWGVPAYQLLERSGRQRVPASAWAFRHSPESFADIALRAKGQGFSSIKFKAYFSDPPELVPEGAAPQVSEDDPVVESVKAISEACGPDFSITVDANCRFYDVDRALGLARALEGYPVVLEDPISWQDNLDGYVRLHRESPVRIAVHVASLIAMAANVAGGALGYAVHSSSSSLLLEVIKNNAADCVNLGGSMTEFVRLAWLAGEAGLPCWHESGLDLGIRDASYIHASLAAPTCTIGGDFIGHLLRADDLVETALSINDGYVEAPIAPGLGVVLDEVALAEYAVGHPASRR